MVAHGPWDLVHCQGYHTLVPPLAMLGALEAKRPYVLTFHSGGHASAVRSRLRRPQRLVLRPLLARASRLVAVSPFEAEMFQRELCLGPQRFATIPNGASLPIPDPVRLAEAGREPLILSVGRLERYKGHQRVVAALPYVLERIPEAKLRIAGAGPYESHLRRQVAALRLNDHVEIAPLDPRDRTAMANLLVRARLVVLLSDYEANPVAVMEALGLSRPVLVTDTSGLRDLAKLGLVRAIALNSPPTIVAAAIVAEMLTPTRATTMALPTWDGCARALLDVYRGAVANRA
jgi:glycosyltransferase involved in cell wall biosynthesis